MSRKNKSVVMDWPDKPDKCLPVNDLLLPLRKIYNEGYNTERKPVLQFHYNGYNIGSADYFTSPTPDERFSPRWLNNESKFNRYLIDNILMMAFQLGMEQGRRHERQNKIPYNILLKMFEIRGEKIKDLSSRLLEYGEDVSTQPNIPLECSNNLDLSQLSDSVEP